MRRFLQIWQGYVRNATANPQTITPLYTVATPGIRYQSEMSREVVCEYHEIRERFNVIKKSPPVHNGELREEAVEFFKDKFGVKHLEGLLMSPIGRQYIFFEHLASLSSKHNGPNTTPPDGTSDGLVEAMRGVTHRRGDKWLSAVKDLVRMVQKITGTLAPKASPSVIIVGYQYLLILMIVPRGHL
ncbi:hypothetical protein EDD15DRAFT_2282601 [Pisolithus albus]|nr:hypothetical protein EDD15DRAFT_2282601 [Pisolithus albus]